MWQHGNHGAGGNQKPVVSPDREDLLKPTSRWMIKSQRRSPRVWKIWALEATVNSSGHPRVGLRMNSQVRRGKQEEEFSMRDLTPREHTS